MNRRRVLGAVGATIALLAGCLSASDDPGESSDGEAKSTQSAESDQHESAESHLQVSVEEHVPDEIDPVDAVDAGLTETDRIAAALDEASDAYEVGMEDDLDERGHRILASVSGDLDGIPDELESEMLYVEYEGVVYLLSYIRISIEAHSE